MAQACKETTTKKSAQRDANTARALAVVRFGHRPPACPPQTNTQTHRQDRLQYTARLASAQCNDVTLMPFYSLSVSFSPFSPFLNRHRVRERRKENSICDEISINLLQ